MNLLIVIVNYRTADLTLACLRSLREQADQPGRRAVVVDSPGGDDSATVLADAIAREGWSRWVSLIALSQNGGFAYGNNAAIRPALQSNHPPKYFLLLNPDTVVHPGAVDELVRFLDEHPQAGMVGSRLEDPDGTPQASAFRFPTALSELVSTMRLGLLSKLLRRSVVAPPIQDKPHETQWLAGASLLVRREVFDDIGLLDDGYFLYYEEVDFCFRARRAGWTCWYLPTSRVVHLVGASSGISDSRKSAPRRPAYWFESRRRYFLKCFGPLRAAMADLLWIVGYCLWRVRRAIQRKPDLDPPHFLNDFLRHSVFRRGFRLI
ncbi:MAG: glycosyltransferase family 2 protein [Phycisphaeraceae bacterium]|nr:glycosyltransferase family 2 protein [Phycisphaeraceae bacterium]